LSVASSALKNQAATGTLAYTPGSSRSVPPLGETFTPASFSGQVTSPSFPILQEGGKEVPYSFALFITIYGSTPLPPTNFSMVATLTSPIRKPPVTQTFPDIFAGGPYPVINAFSFTAAEEPCILFVQLSDYTVAGPPRISLVPSLVGTLFGGVAVDGGGTVLTSGVPGPVPPWGPLVAGIDPATRDVLLGITLDEIARSISDPLARAAVRSAILSEMSRSVGLLAQSVSQSVASAEPAGSAARAERADT
jgi:hypothetical protein